MQRQILFKRLGFGKNAHLVYEVLLRSKEPLSVMAIARVGKIGRPEVYRNIEKLIAQRLIKKIFQKKRVYYTAENPHRLEEIFSATVRDVETTSTTLAVKYERLMPDHVRYFKGPAGIRAIFDDAITRTPRGETFFRYTSERDLAEVNRYLSPKYRVVRDKKRLARLVISNPVSGKQKRPRLERFIKYIPSETALFDQNIIQLVYADCVAFINLNVKEGFIVMDKALADFQAVIFKQLYKKL